MSAFLIGLLIFTSITAASLLGMGVYPKLPSPHRNSDTKDVVKLAMGMVATMTALILGLLVSSAKDKFAEEDKALKGIGVKLIFVDRILASYGQETQPIRTAMRQAFAEKLKGTLSENQSQFAQLAPQRSTTAELYFAVQDLAPQNESQRVLKNFALSNMYDISQAHWMVAGQADSSVCVPLLVFVICWLGTLFFSFALFAPSNGTVKVAFIIAAFCVASAVFLILELDTPFSGFLKISNQPLVQALGLLNS